MKIQPVASPNAIQQPASNEAAHKARAIAAFNQSQQTTQPVVQNQTRVSAEEMTAIQPQVRQDESIEATQEVPEVVATTETKTQEDPVLSRQFAQLARQEKALRAKVQQQEQQYKAREAALQAREAALTSEPKTDMTKYISRDHLKQDALTALAEAGVSYEELTQQIISQQPVDPRLKNTINQLQQQIQELKAANEEARKSQVDNQTQAYQAAVKQIRTDVNQLVHTDPNFETIKATKSAKDVVDLIEQTYHKDGVLLSVEEAATQVEDYLVEEGAKLAQIDKIKKRMMQAVAPKASSSTAQTPAAKSQQQQQPMKTLTNAASSTRQLSAKERAILAFKGELKS